MADAGVPTARARVVTTVDAGMAAVAELGLPVAVKADGLAAGKGVWSWAPRPRRARRWRPASWRPPSATPAAPWWWRRA